MTGTLLMLALGGLLVVLLICFQLRTETRTDEGAPGDRAGHGRAWEEREDEMLDRIFAGEDWEFLEGRGPAEAQRVFLKERRQIAFCWLSLMQDQAKAAMRHHVWHARKFEELQPLLEGKIALSYLFFRINCRILAMMISLRGPVGLQRAVARARGISARLLGLADLGVKTGGLVAGTQGR